MKKAALISPKGNIFGRNQRMISFLEKTKNMESFRFLWAGPNLGLLTLASLFPPDWECDYIDENYLEIDYDCRYDMVFIGAMTQQAVNAYEISTRFRNRGILTIIGGIHATVMPHEAGKYADIVMAGECEALWPLFIQDYIRGSLKKLYTEERPGSYSFERARLPRYDLLMKYNYPLVTLQTTRGCPHDCYFCCASKTFGYKYRRKDNQVILKELAEISKRFPGVLVLFADDNMLVLRKKSKDLLRQMTGMDIRWIAQTDISIAEDDELLKLMVRSGCQWIVVGFESISTESLANLDQKNWKLRQLPNYSHYIKRIQSYGISIYGTFIVGMDDDDRDTFRKTADFIIENGLYGANITVPTPLPGTRMRQKMEEEKRIFRNDWSYYTFWDVNINPKQMSPGELEEGLLSVYQRISSDIFIAERVKMLKRAVKIRKEIMSQNKFPERKTIG